MATQPPLVLDASAAIVLFASGHIRDIVRSLPSSVFVVQETIEEVRYLRNPSMSEKPAGREPVDWQSVLDDGLTSVLQRTAAEEFAAFVRLAQLVDEGEAAAAAAAMHRGYDLVIDDPKARRVLQGTTNLLWSLDILHQWCHAAKLASVEISAILADVRQGNVPPPRAHPQPNWWQQHFLPE